MPAVTMRLAKLIRQPAQAGSRHILLMRDSDGLYQIVDVVRTAEGQEDQRAVITNLDSLARGAQHFDDTVRVLALEGYAAEQAKWLERTKGLLGCTPASRAEAKVFLADHCAEPGVGEVITLLRRTGVPTIYADEGSRQSACLVALAMRGYAQLAKDQKPLQSGDARTIALASSGDARSLYVALGVLKPTTDDFHAAILGDAATRSLVL